MKKMFSESFAIAALGCSALLYSVTGCSHAPEAPPKVVEIQADDKMRFDVTAFEAKPGQKISVTLKNVGTTPKFSMGHNFVMLDRTVTTAKRAEVPRRGVDGGSPRLRSAGFKRSARAHEAARAWRERHGHVQCAIRPGRISLSLLVPWPLHSGHKGLHDSEINQTTRTIENT